MEVVRFVKFRIQEWRHAFVLSKNKQKFRILHLVKHFCFTSIFGRVCWRTPEKGIQKKSGVSMDMRNRYACRCAAQMTSAHKRTNSRNMVTQKMKLQTTCTGTSRWLQRNDPGRTFVERLCKILSTPDFRVLQPIETRTLTSTIPLIHVGTSIRSTCSSTSGLVDQKNVYPFRKNSSL